MTAPTTPGEIGEVLRHLRDDLARYPEDRYPVQRATAFFHLGSVLAGARRFEEAEGPLAESARLFDPEGLPIEHGKALIGLGAVLRELGRIREAGRCFELAASAFERAEAPLELGAALFNLGLVHRGEDDAGAVTCFERARELFRDGRAKGQEGSAGRELGAALLAEGRPDAAAEALERAVRLADEAGDREGLGEGQNVLGLAELARGRLPEAVDAFKASAGVHPRGLRPQGYAMAKANLATAFEAAGEQTRARLAASQALGVPDVPPAVRGQAQDVLERVGTAPGALVSCLLDEPSGSRPALVREELMRWADTTPEERIAEARAWVRGQLSADDGPGLAEAWLGGLLELPPEDMRGLIRAALDASAELEPEVGRRFRGQVVEAMGAFHVPQWMRLKDTFVELAEERGVKGWR